MNFKFKDKKIPKVALIGRPNVGKSTLLNRLTRTRDALVDSTPGLTRDRRYAELRWEGLAMQLIDTGGMDRSPNLDRISQIVHEQSLKAVEESDLLLIVLDVKEGITPADREIVDALRPYKKPYLVIINKVDNPSRELDLGEFYELGVNEVIPVSAEHGRGVNALMTRVVDVFKHMDLPLEDSSADLEGLTQESKEQLVKVALIGRPNTGKSSLLNRLVGEPRMIVTDVPGTTRDAIDTLLQRPGRKDVLLTDTAGIRRKARVSDKIEKFSIIKAINIIKACDIVLIVMDISEGITDQDKRLIGYTERYGRACITLFNKCDLIQQDQPLVKLRSGELERAKRFIPYSPHLNISALTGKRVNRILPLIDNVYVDFNALINTGTVNSVLQKALAKRTPPVSRGHYLKLYYTTQVATKPPTFLLFANYPDVIPSQYKRFLANQFREQLGLKQTPIRILFRKRERR
ncbi:MAG: ribosome biogenesis GTPase Der [Thermodesulfobacteriota bacterium]|nr:ribosome biogenesis GTPase Der [Thermodesulfobacteriota bacterium]